jgi:DNA-binding transcriptional MerR regulator
MQRAGNRRYYRPADVELARRINRLLNEEGYTVRGVQKVLRDKDAPPVEAATPAAESYLPEDLDEAASGIDVFRLISLRNRLAEALER